MRRLILILFLAVPLAACYAAPGTQRSDIGSASTVQTGDYQVVERRVVDEGHYHLKVRAAIPENAELIAANIRQQMRSLSAREVVIEVSPLEGREGETRTIAWTRPKGTTTMPRDPGTTLGTGGADRPPMAPADTAR
jgi:hypothetical protein